jgi:hypothetical protein
MTRGRRGSLALRRRALPSPPPCRFIPALSPNPRRTPGTETLHRDATSLPTAPAAPVFYSRVTASRALRVADAIGLRPTLDPATRPQNPAAVRSKEKDRTSPSHHLDQTHRKPAAATPCPGGLASGRAPAPGSPSTPALVGLTKSARGRREPIKPSTTRHVHKQVDKPELFAAIRYAARRDGLSIRAIEARFHVHRRTIRQALASPIPPPRKQAVRPSRVLVGLDRLIDDLLDAQPGIRIGHIWERLIDDHDANVSYASVRDYVAKRRQTNQNPDRID